MAYINKFSISNFRIFKEKTSFDISPITILTGSNSSGKSSLIKALLLIKDNIEKNDLMALDTSKDDLQLGTFRDVKNFHLKDKGIEFDLGFTYDKFDKAAGGIPINDFIFSETPELRYNFIDTSNEKGRIYRIDLFIGEDSIFTIFKFEKDDKIVSGIYVSVLWFIEKYISKLNSKNAREKENKENEKILKGKKEIQIQPETSQNLQSDGFEEINNISNFFEDRKSFGGYSDQYEKFKNFTGEIFNSELIVIELKPYYKDVTINNLIQKIYDLFLGEIQILQLPEDFVIPLNTFENFVKSYSDFILFKFPKYPIDGVSLYNLNDEVYQLDKLMKLNKKQKELIGHITIGELISPDFKKFIKKILAPNLTAITKLNKNLEIVHLPSTRGTLQRLYKDSENGILNRLLAKNRKKDDKDSDIKFINKWLSKFNIAESIKFEGVEGVATKVTLTKNGELLSLADYGFGVSQLLPIILKIIDYPKPKDYYEPVNPGIFIIEEAEANLHPALQSKLADLIVDAVEDYAVQFILETHSEYLIRRLQYLVAKKTISPDLISLYYFDKNEKEIANKIEFDKLGNLKKKFGKGFLDEATTLEDELKHEQEKQKLKAEKVHLEKLLKEVSDSTKCLVLTEDEDMKFCKAIFIDILGYKKDEVSFMSFEGSSNLHPVMITSSLLVKDKPNLQQVIFHRDRDIYEDEDLIFVKAKEKLAKLNKKGAINFHLFITEDYDMESYFINAQHVNELYPKLGLDKIEKLIEQATDECEQDSIGRLLERLGTKKHGIYKSMKALEEKYHSNKKRYRYGKKVSALIQMELKKTPNLIKKSPHIRVEDLEDIRIKIWGESLIND